MYHELKFDDKEKVNINHKELLEAFEKEKI